MRMLRSLFSIYSDFVYLIITGKRRNFNQKFQITDLSNEKANEIANQRREKIDRLLIENKILNYEFLELPNEEREFEKREKMLESFEESCGQFVRLKWQIKSTEFLLLERLIDLIISTRNLYYLPKSFPLIKIEPLEEIFRKDGIFPWKAVIESDRSLSYQPLLELYKDWIGISIEFREMKFNNIKQNGKCQNSDKEGTIGGHIIYEGNELAMTCSHVLAHNCLSLKCKGNPFLNPSNNSNIIWNGPDAALINQTSCFPYVSGTKNFLSCANDQIILTAANNRVSVIKTPIKEKDNIGFIVTQVGFMPISNNGMAYRFPHLQVRRIQKSYFFGLFKFPFNPHFSQPGDSGSWVIDRSTNIWYGMVIGSDDLNVTYLANSEPLLEFFKLLLDHNNSNSRYKSSIKPFIYN